MRKFVLNLPGPLSSYCRCKYPCSPIEIDHVMPKKLLKLKIKNSEELSKAMNDPNNLYSCCSKKNRKKGHLILNEKNPGDEFNGLKARSSLYMNYKYSLNFNSKLISIWKTYSYNFPPYEFEKKRAELISEKFDTNHFIVFFPKTRFYKD